MRWVRLNKYTELSGESRDTVHWKRKAGIYIDGVHTKIADDNRVWVNLEAIEQWVEQGSKSFHAALPSADTSTPKPSKCSSSGTEKPAERLSRLRPRAPI